MKEFALGFLLSLSLCLSAYIAWESYRHVPVVIQQVPIPVQSMPMPQSGSQLTNL